jgi:protein-disulfide isomerase
MFRPSSAAVPAVLCLLMTTMGAARGQTAHPGARPAAKAPSAAKALVAAAKPPAGAKSALDKTTLEAYVRHRFFFGPQYGLKILDPKPGPLPGYQEVVVEVSAGQAMNQIPLYVSADGQKVIFGEVYDINKNPFAYNLTRLKTDFQPSFGSAGAPVVIVIFSDYQCPYCRDEAAMIREKVRAEYPSNVRVYFKDFPLEAIHPWAKQASIAGRCVFRQNPGAFWDFHDWIYKEQPTLSAENLRAKVLEFAGSKGIEPLQFGQCYDKRATEAEVNKEIAEGRSLSIDQTPTLFVNGRKLVGNVTWDVLKQVIDREIEYQKTAHDAGEQACCEVKLPSPLPNQ